jgi:hypothetical protein
VPKNVELVSAAHGARADLWQAIAETCLWVHVNGVLSLKKRPGSIATPGSNLGLFLAVLFDVRLRCLFGMSSGVSDMTPRRMSMVCRFLVTSGLVMLGRFRVVACGVGMMF